MNNKKGFTLIELLAVIVILAVIALIVTPIVTGIISSAKKGAAARSLEGYVSSVELAQVKYQTINNGTFATSLDYLELEGNNLQKIKNSNVTFDENGLVSEVNAIVDDYKCIYNKKDGASCIKCNNTYIINYDSDNYLTSESVVSNAMNGLSYYKYSNDVFDFGYINGKTLKLISNAASQIYSIDTNTLLDLSTLNESYNGYYFIEGLALFVNDDSTAQQLFDGSQTKGVYIVDFMKVTGSKLAVKLYDSTLNCIESSTNERFE